ncbi:hypothetical protein AX17_003578 [Amanita inopinata Kibby_2008]|nr:hypothetical protein AX17_003578 [Amanita inopinata Kibby_2008]
MGPLMPFSISHIILTPHRVRLPGEKSPSLPIAGSKAPWSPLQWSRAVGARVKTLRSLGGARLLSFVPANRSPVQGISELGELHDENLDGQQQPVNRPSYDSRDKA